MFLNSPRKLRLPLLELANNFWILHEFSQVALHNCEMETILPIGDLDGCDRLLKTSELAFHPSQRFGSHPLHALRRCRVYKLRLRRAGQDRRCIFDRIIFALISSSAASIRLIWSHFPQYVKNRYRRQSRPVFRAGIA